MRALLWRLLAIFRGNRLDAQLDDEVCAHLDLLAADYVRRGMTPQEARLAARRAFGGVEPMKEAYRHRRGLPWVEDTARDVRHALRLSWRTPVLTAVTVMTLALGIGATTALFTIVREVLLRRLPVSHPEELVELGCIDPLRAPDDSGACDTSFEGFMMYRAAPDDVIAGALAFAPIEQVDASFRGATESAQGMLVSGDAYRLLGVEPHVGRVLSPADDRPAAPLVAVLSHSYWQRRFGGDPGVLGQSVRLNAEPATIVGVAAASFRGLTLGDVPDVMVPLASADLFLGKGTLANGGSWWLRVIARRRPDVPIERVEQALEPTFRRVVAHNLASVPAALAARIRDGTQRLQFDVKPAAVGAQSDLRGSLVRPLRILTGAVFCFLLIACTNVAGVLGSRAMSRQREFGVRLALGATRARLFRQMLAETTVVAAAGGLLGVAIAQWVAPPLTSLAAGDAAMRALRLSPNPAVLIFAAVTSIVTGALASIGGMLQVSNADPQSTLKAAARYEHRLPVTRLLLGAQCALTMLLLVGAGVFLETLANLRALDPGFASEGRAMADVASGLARYDAEGSIAYVNRAIAALNAAPGIQSATVSADPVGSLGNTTLVDVAGFESAPTEERMVGRNVVGARFAETVGLHLLHGRDITIADSRTSARVALVNESFARHYFGTANAVGRRFRLLGQPEAHSIVGVVSDARDRGVRTPSGRVVYEAPLRHPEDGVTITVRGIPGNRDLLAAVERTLRRVDADVPVRSLRTVEADIESGLRRERLLGLLTTSFGGVALFLVALGLYGTLSGMVVRRTHEIGVRLALGSTPSGTWWLVTRDVVAIVVGGSAIGVIASFALARFVQGQLFDVSPSDPGVVASALAALVVVALMAAILPARRALRLDPMVALRRE
jgi:predicted permease